MNINPLILKLEEILHIPVEQDEYTGNQDCYITFTYEDERSHFYADNQAHADTVYVQIKLYTPKSFDYFELKGRMKSYFEEIGFRVSVKTFLGDTFSGTEHIRTTLFSATYTEQRKGE